MNIRILFLVVAALCQPSTSLAQAYPGKPIRLVMPSSPGGGTEFSVRLALEKMRDSLGQPVVLDFHPGAGGTIGAEMVARAAPDGYTLVYSVPDPMVMRPILSKNVTYDPIRDFTPITAMVASYIWLIANPGFPASSITELLDHARRNPGKVSYGTNGIGTGSHFLGFQIARLGGVELLHVPYKSFAPAVTAVVSGEIQVLVSAAGTSTPLVKTGKVKALAVLDNRRNPSFPDVPPITDVLPKFLAMPSWLAFFGPARMPREIVDRWQSEISRAVNSPDVRSKLEAQGQRIIANTPEQFAQQIRTEVATIRELAKATGVQPE